MAKNQKMKFAVESLSDVLKSEHPRFCITVDISFEYISADDPWVDMALRCKDEADIPDIALEHFLADCKSGYYDMPPKEGLYDNHDIEPVSTP